MLKLGSGSSAKWQTVQVLLLVFVATAASASEMVTPGDETWGLTAASATQSKVVVVDCDKGKTLADALTKHADRLVIEFSGTCHEQLVVERDDVVFRGAGAGATLVGAIRLVGAQRIVVEGFTIRDNPEFGGSIDVRNGASARIREMTVLNSRDRGIQVLNGTAEISDVLVDGVAAIGILFRGGHGIFSGNITTLNSPIEAGIFLTNSSSVLMTGGSLVSQSNSLGFVVQNNSTFEAALHVPINVDNNTFGGLLVLTQGSFSYAGTLDAKNNGVVGLLITEGSTFAPFFGFAPDAATTVTGNRVIGVSAQRGAIVDLTAETTISGSLLGISLDDAMIRLQNTTVSGNTLADLRLRFGSHATSLGASSFGTIDCDGTELVRGPGLACP